MTVSACIGVGQRHPSKALQTHVTVVPLSTSDGLKNINHIKWNLDLLLFWIQDVFWLGLIAYRCWDPIAKHILSNQFLPPF